jgi:hypothetical protein
MEEGEIPCDLTTPVVATATDPTCALTAEQRMQYEEMIREFLDTSNPVRELDLINLTEEESILFVPELRDLCALVREQELRVRFAYRVAGLLTFRKVSRL